MKTSVSFHVPSCGEFRKGYQAFNARESKGHCYFDAVGYVSKHWGKPDDMAYGVGIIISCWNRFYAKFDYKRLATCISGNLGVINQFRARDISSLSDTDSTTIEDVFDQFLDALARTSDGHKSPVSVAKCFGVLTPDFLPIWDSTIAWKYGDLYLTETAADHYVAFCSKMQIMASNVRQCVPTPDDRSLLKRIDEYNYAKYTMGWI